MSQNDLIIMALAVLIVGVILYKQINKVTQNITINDENPNLAYSKFCSAIDDQIDILRQKALENQIVNQDNKDEILENLSDFSKELVFIESLNSKESDKWQEKLFGLLSRIDEFVEQNFINGKDIASDIKDNLKIEFDKLGLDRG
ncbi:MAG: hypothetical protein SPI60_04250 [Campylobacter lanienae]|uniref:hypothetical protein n=1 Tax=Campylobacter lanienae TaxID=75658 RepID=UPI00242ED157|nr:hypothetical protein [Campylobacter lanienae]MCI7364107.1 hypothetical protein [Campylobacter lanienae]MDY3133029.1 hypothetical protein [Campylobacter lanienae]MDY6056999.1 hypothetical protein [Campylobacter lanienae]MDY6135437.1 hypothetical protein [Campylobacter lanienae]